MGKNKVTLALCFCAIALVVSSLVYFQNHTPSETADLSSTSSNESEEQYRGPVHDCVQYDVLYRGSNPITSVCTGNYVHFYPDNMNPKSAESTTGEIKIGSFNLFHLGDNVAPLKHIGLMAKVINQWDVAGVQEMMPLTNEWAYANMAIHKLLTENNSNFQPPFKNWRIVFPGYLQLLMELQKQDPSWALILQPIPEGEGTTGEMAGFFYRSKKVRLKEWGYCPSDRSVDIKTTTRAANYACLLQIPPDQRRLMSRVAFTAYFQAGNFDFVGVTTHVRFNYTENEAERKEQASDLCSFHVNEAKCKPAKDEVGRFFEVAAIANQFKDIVEISGDKDVVFSGDFNLQDDAKSKELWAAALKASPGYIVTQQAPTTLSIKANKTVSNYDHFIVDPKALGECDMKSVRAFDFTTADISSDSVMREIAKFLKPDMQNLLLQDQKNYLAILTKYQTGRGKTPDSIRALNDKEKTEMLKDYTESAERMKQNKTGALLELLSDHVPIEMKCRIPSKDDD